MLRNILLTVGIGISGSAAAEFGPTNRSINGTGETLAANKCEVGLRTLACGVTDNVLISAPMLSILTGDGEVEMRRRFGLFENMRITPAITAGTPIHFGGRLDLGIDLGMDRQHSVTLTFETKWSAKTAIPVEKYSPDKAYRFTGYLGGEYDFYFAGNVAYIGLVRQVPYLGYTWAWEHFHVGLITSNRSRFFPIPYFYWRF